MSMELVTCPLQSRPIPQSIHRITRTQPAFRFRRQPELCQQAMGVPTQDGFAVVEATDRTSVIIVWRM